MKKGATGGRAGRRKTGKGAGTTAASSADKRGIPARTKKGDGARGDTSRYESGKWAEAFEPRKPGEIRYWLVKSEADVFSFSDLMAAPGRTTFWDGVRNYAARNFMKDGMRVGDLVYYYHSMADPQCIVGICEVVREGYADHTALDRKHDGFDPKSDAASPTWYMVDIRAVRPLQRPVALQEIKAQPELAGMALLRVGRLSVSPVTKTEWDIILRMAGEK